MKLTLAVFALVLSGCASAPRNTVRDYCRSTGYCRGAGGPTFTLYQLCDRYLDPCKRAK